MKVLVDTNILLDVLCDRAGVSEEAAKVWKLCECRQLEGYVYALSIANIVYIMRKELPRNQIGDVLDKLTGIFTIADMKADDFKKAAQLPIQDFEDALQSVCASRIKANYIVTRDLKHYGQSKVMAIKPSELIERVVG